MSESVAGPGKVVAFHYTLFDEEDNLLESTANGDPVLFLYGQRGVLANLQEGFKGRSAGEEFSVSIPHTQAYGRYYPERRQRIAKKLIDGGKSQAFRVGQIITVRSGQHGAQQATIMKVGRFNLDIDTNHPLAGRDLRFDCRVESVRDASEEEIAHGHAHGPGGHQH